MATTITTRSGKGSALTWQEMDGNFNNIRTRLDNDLELRLQAVEAGQNSSALGYTTKALLDADLAHVAGTMAVVTNDATADNNTYWIKLGGSGSGSWQKSAVSAFLPYYSSRQFTTLAQAITAIGNSNTTVLRMSSSLTVTDGDTVPANISILVDNGGMFVGSGTEDLTINGPFHSGQHQAFSAVGALIFSSATRDISPSWFYDGSGNWAPAINKAINSATTVQRVILPAGTLPVYGSGTELILYDRMVHLEGAGKSSTILQVAASVGNTTDVLRISPDMGGYGYGVGAHLSDFSILPASGTPARHAVYLDTMSAAQIINDALIESLRIGQFGGNGIYQSQHATDPDGFFSSTIRNNFIYGGISLNRAGDTLRIENNVMLGTNYGIYADLVSGANILNIVGNVIVSNGGGVYIYNAGMVLIDGNQFEQQINSTGTDRALVVIKGASAGISKTRISNNKFNLPATLVDTGLILDNAVGAVVENNIFTPGVSTQCMIRITASGVGNAIGDNMIDTGGSPLYNSWRTALRNTTYIQDGGKGTVGIRRPLSLLNSWANMAGSTVAIEKIDNNTVTLTGICTAGNKTNGIQVTTIPAGFIPEGNVIFSVLSYNSVNGYVPVQFVIDPNTGNATLQGIGANTVRVFFENVTWKIFY